MATVAVLGTGVVGSSWALVFARAGYDVRVFDISESALAATTTFVRQALGDLTKEDLAGPDPIDVVMARLHTTTDLAAAVVGADYIQESLPERVELKRSFYVTLDELVSPLTVIGSSTSGLPASSFTEGLRNAARCLVVHPINPPHLIPLVEIIPAPWTEASAVERAVVLMRDVGQSPVTLTREINGFLVNRLQSAVLGEAFRLVEDGVCDVDAVDKAIKDGLGLRWFFMGPFETIDLNASQGVSEYCRNLGPMYENLAREQADPRSWSPQLVAKINAAMRAATPMEKLTEKRGWRDRCLASFVSAKKRVLGARTA
ncbi:3-hydroxyacyl-CoA dehydrogenase [Starkeya sp. 3C]|uniref:L-gulonate 3-dehydrogenase n=1 Tax=Ancylobacter moscoviensis TaxID=2597768 RepID=A0ABY3DP67_9HYPH|nr:3-hydroxyacyl-CoA dehydrogenase [Ancylobacter moscoviensis]TSJ61377.1 3-hydroxyacyl-CoA dehydrogenase [Ancylobacter moscoviensis]